MAKERDPQKKQQHIILFYKYHPLSSDWDVTGKYRLLLLQLCQSLQLTGRLLVGCSKTEGINGTMAGKESNVRAFTRALLPPTEETSGGFEAPIESSAVDTFREQSAAFFASIGEPILLMDSPDDFKWSTSSECSNIFPDLHIRLTAELIGTGGLLSNIGIDDTAVGYLSPAEWHRRMQDFDANDTVVIDCRNVKEHQIGHFRGAVDPGTRSFGQFPKWVRDNSYQLEGKKVMMYCTGGIRCEKASAFIRNEVPGVQEVSHLRGGIHKYLEEFDTGEHWLGKNFVFDNRWAMPSRTSVVVGQCLECEQSFDQFDPHCVCTVCREPTLVCDACREQLVEYHCSIHANIKHCYFTNLDSFSVDDLKKQLLGLETELEALAVGRKFKQKRRSLVRQSSRVQAKIDELKGGVSADQKQKSACSKCGSADGCPGRCWGFNGKQSASTGPSSNTVLRPVPNCPRQSNKKRPKRGLDDFLQAANPPSRYRDVETGVRVPHCTMRTLECHIKAKWCSMSVLQVIQEQFFVGKPKALHTAMQHGLLKLNGRSITPELACSTRLKTSDSLARIVHWHEAPVMVPEQLEIQTVQIPTELITELASDDDAAGCHEVYVCNKPASVPVHPAGPYLANSLTLMTAAQLQLPSVQPLHRIDRATSGLMLLCNSTAVARKFQQRLAEPNCVRKLYIAHVAGQFPASEAEASAELTNNTTTATDGQWKWRTSTAECAGCIQVDAAIHTVDPAAGIRVIDAKKGKSATSRFQRISFDGTNSLLACWLISGRNHQLRVHLQYLGFPICGDTLYGGKSEPRDTCNETTVLRLLEEASKNRDAVDDPEESLCRKACPCCNNGASQSFTQAQLLQGGHAIRLHALKYKISFAKEEQHGPMEFQVGPPSWVSEQDRVTLDKIAWDNED